MYISINHCSHIYTEYILSSPYVYTVSSYPSLLYSIIYPSMLALFHHCTYKYKRIDRITFSSILHIYLYYFIYVQTRVNQSLSQRVEGKTRRKVWYEWGLQMSARMCVCEDCIISARLTQDLPPAVVYTQPSAWKLMVIMWSSLHHLVCLLLHLASFCSSCVLIL